MIKKDIIIIGAGLTGLLLAKKLKPSGKECLILEKSRGLGGRVATRRIDEMGLDHGASFLSQISHDSELKFFTAPQGFFLKKGMNNLAKELSKDLEILKEQKIQKIIKVAEGWQLVAENGTEFECQKLILTAPLPQAMELLKQNSLAPDSSHPLHEIHYSKAIILLATLSDLQPEMQSLDFESHHFLLMKERDHHPNGLVMHLSQNFSEEFFEHSDEEILKEVMNILKRSPFLQNQIQKFELKKWRYSRPMSTYPAPYLEISPDLYLAGDAFATPLESAEALIKVL